MLSLSTSWNAMRHTEGTPLVDEIKGIGFDWLEVNYQVTARQLADIVKLQGRGEIKISSLHNIVPKPEEADPNTAHRLFPFTSPDPEVRQKAVELTKQSIDYAAILGAGAVVLHLGECWDAPLLELERNFVNAKLKSRQSGNKLDELREKLVKDRKEYSGEGLKRIRECLDSLAPYAEEKKVKLGFENRYWYTQFPNVEELESLLSIYASPGAGLWFDVGHAAAQEYWGFQRKNEVLDKFSNRLIGVHLMDCIRSSDHLAPGKGQVNFAELSKYLRPDTIKVLEMAIYVTAEEIQSGVSLLHKQGIS